MEAPVVISASLGATVSLQTKLDKIYHFGNWAPLDRRKDEIEQLRTDVGFTRDRLQKLSEVKDPPNTARSWMKDVRELSYDMDDWVDQLIVHANGDAKNDWIEKKISGFKARLEEMKDRYVRYELDNFVPSSTTWSTSGHVGMDLVEEKAVGMEKQTSELERLLTDEGEQQLKVVSIVGVPGIGKTTVAQKVWHRLGGQFDCRAYVQTAKKPDMRMILRNMLTQVSPNQPNDTWEVHKLIHHLREHLQKKRYFIIVEDLWAISVWDVLRRGFPENNNHSRIITTTTIKDIALACCNYEAEHIFNMKPLSISISKKLFLDVVLGSGKRCPEQFNSVIYEITKKCGGLPLAIICVANLVASQLETQPSATISLAIAKAFSVFFRTMAAVVENALVIGAGEMATEGFVSSGWELQPQLLAANTKLASDQDQKHWDLVPYNSLRENPTPEEILNAVLEHCYSKLPHYLKTCLMYLSVYPENYTILKDDLVKQWTAEGFISGKDGKDVPEVGENYFNELFNLGLIQRDINYNDEVSSYVVPHMVLDLITRKCIEDNFITVIDYSQTKMGPSSDKVRRLSLHFGSATYATTPPSINLSQVRSLSFMGLLNRMPSIRDFKLLRVAILHIWGDNRNKCFNLTGIKELFRLIYLQIRCNVTVKLPDEVNGLKHLETLEINARVEAIPSDIFSVPTLLYLRLGREKDLPTMNSKLKYLNLRLASGTTSACSSPVDLQRFEMLPPICCFARLPEWIRRLHKLRILKIVIRELHGIDIDILAGLPALTILSLYVLQPTAEIINFKGGSFPALKYLEYMCGVLSLEFQKEAMPHLTMLKVGFNAHRGEKYRKMLAGIQHLLSLKEIAGKIGAAHDAEESDKIDAESALSDAISRHSRSLNSNVTRVDWVDEEYPPSEKQKWKEYKDSSIEPYWTQGEDLSSEQPRNTERESKGKNKCTDSGSSQVSIQPEIHLPRQKKPGNDIGTGTIKMYYKNYRTHWSHPQHALVRCKYSDRSGYVCYLCNFGLSGLIGFRCEACDFDIHEECADFKETIDGASFAHRHVFTFSRVVGTEDDFCLVCRMDCPRERFYRCAPCNFNVCINCARHVFHPPWSGPELDNIVN